MIEVELPNGDIIEFPDNATQDVIQNTVKRIMGQPSDEQQPSGKQVQQRIDQAFDTPAMPDPGSEFYDNRGYLVPVARNMLTGQDERWQMPGIVQDIAEAATTPIRYYRGELQMDPETMTPQPQDMERFVNLSAMGAPLTVGSRMARSAMGGMPVARAQRLRDEQAALERTLQAEQFGIPLTGGQQRRGDLQAQEQQILHGVQGGEPQRIMQDAMTAQAEQVGQASRDLIDEVAPGQVAGGQEAGLVARDAVRDTAQGLQREAGQLFDQVRDSDANIALDAMPGLERAVFDSLEQFGANQGTQVGAGMPNVQNLYGKVAELARTANAPEGATGVQWGAIQRLREQMNNFSKGGGTEAAAIGEMRRGLDQWADNVAMQGLVSGDQDTLNNLKRARSLWSRFRNITNNPQLAIRKMAEGSIDGAQAANYIMGLSQVGSKSAGANVIREMRNILGDNQAPIDEIKRGVLMRLFNDASTGDNKTYGRLASDITKFAKSDTSELARELFGPEGLKRLEEFAGVLRTLTPDAINTNPPRSGFVANRGIRDMINRLAPFVGFAAADLTGAIAAMGLQVAGNRAARRQAQRLANPDRPYVPENPRVGGRVNRGLVAGPTGVEAFEDTARPVVRNARTLGELFGEVVAP